MEPSVSKGGERERGGGGGGGRRGGEEEKGDGKRKGRGERRGRSKREERKEGEREEVSINSFPVWSVLHVQYKCKALKMLTTDDRGREKERERGGRRGMQSTEDADHRGLFPQKNKQNLQNHIGESRTNGHIVCGGRGRHVCYKSTFPLPLSIYTQTLAYKASHDIT